MGYLDNTTLVVDAILTKRGRELIAKGDGSFKITQFAVADDEIDYNLDQSDIIGEGGSGSMPLLEAFPDERYIMKHKLLTANRGLTRIPLLQVGFDSITLLAGGSFTFHPKTINFPGVSNNVEPSGYSVMISDARLLSEFRGNATERSFDPDPIRIDPTGISSKTVVGTTFTLRGSMTGFEASNEKKGTITIVGRDSGARITVPITIKQQQVTSSS